MTGESVDAPDTASHEPAEVSGLAEELLVEEVSIDGMCGVYQRRADRPIAVLAQDFDLDAGWMLSPSVAVRPEPFGALLYHFGTRRLSFLKSRQLLEVVQALGSAPTARAACDRAGVSAAGLPAVTAALASLHAGGSLCLRTADPAASADVA